MRIIAGSARGRKLFSPEGMDVRPTTDKVKESLFNIIQFEIPGARVLDLFSGTGQLGLEALSRGAAEAVFVDASGKSLATVKKNVALCGFGDRSRLVSGDAFAYLARGEGPFDLVFLDPPYHKGLCGRALELLPPCLGEQAAVICETQADEVLPERCGELVLHREYRYSAIMLRVYRRKEREE